MSKRSGLFAVEVSGHAAAAAAAAAAAPAARLPLSPPSSQPPGSPEDTGRGIKLRISSSCDFPFPFFSFF